MKRHSFSRLGTIGAALCFGTLLGTGTGHAADLNEDLAVYLDGKQTAAAIAKAQGDLMGKDAAKVVDALAERYKSADVDSQGRLRIIALLGVLKSEDSAAVLQKICTRSVLTVADVRDWGGLARAVQAGEKRETNDPFGRVWKGLAEAEQKTVSKLAAGDGGAAPLPERLAMLNGLNRVIGDENFYSEPEMTQYAAAAEAKTLVERWRNRNAKNRPPEDRFTSSEARQLNEYLLRAMYPEALQSRYAIPTQQYESQLADAATQELTAMTDQPVAEAAIINLDPDPYQARKHILALGRIRGQAAMERLFQYLKCESVAASNLSRDQLKLRMESDAYTLTQAILDTVKRYEYRDAKAALPAHASRSMLELAMALPNEADRLDIMQRALKSENLPLRDAAFDALKLAPKLVSNEDIREAVTNRLEGTPSEETVLAILGILQLSGDTESLPLVVTQLDHESKAVRVQAAKAMEGLTGERLGSNPATWKKWWANKHPSAADEE